MGWFTVKAGTNYDTALPCALRLLYLAASVDLKSRVLYSLNLARGVCEELPGMYRHHEELRCCLKLGGM